MRKFKNLFTKEVVEEASSSPNAKKTIAKNKRDNVKAVKTTVKHDKPVVDPVKSGANKVTTKKADNTKAKGEQPKTYKEVMALFKPLASLNEEQLAEKDLKDFEKTGKLTLADGSKVKMDKKRLKKLNDIKKELSPKDKKALEKTIQSKRGWNAIESLIATAPNTEDFEAFLQFAAKKF